MIKATQTHTHTQLSKNGRHLHLMAFYMGVWGRRRRFNKAFGIHRLLIKWDGLSHVWIRDDSFTFLPVRYIFYTADIYLHDSSLWLARAVHLFSLAVYGIWEDVHVHWQVTHIHYINSSRGQDVTTRILITKPRSLSPPSLKPTISLLIHISQCFLSFPPLSLFFCFSFHTVDVVIPWLCFPLLSPIYLLPTRSSVFLSGHPLPSLLLFTT